MSVEFDLSKNLGVETYLMSVEEADLITDIALFFQSLNSAPARALRQADAFSDLTRGSTRILLQRSENFPIYLIKHNVLTIMQLRALNIRNMPNRQRERNFFPRNLWQKCSRRTPWHIAH
jgi:hypothetical protein